MSIEIGLFWWRWPVTPAQLVAIDDGPGDVFTRFRAWAGSLENDRARSYLGGLVHCAYCVGLYAALVLAPAVIWPQDVRDFALIVLGSPGRRRHYRAEGRGGIRWHSSASGSIGGCDE